jgi:hypothetical protein
MADQKEMKALEEKGIKEGDVVSTPYRGGTREGVVSNIATSKEETPHPPKVAQAILPSIRVCYRPACAYSRVTAQIGCPHAMTGPETRSGYEPFLCF